MNVILSDASGVVFDKHCGLIGKIVKTTATGSTSWLDHTVICGAKDSFNTSLDKADVVGVAYPLVSVHEVVSRIKNSKGFFEGMQAEIFADGTLNLVTGVNSFQLSGQVCLTNNN
jgi:hypothetical protein